MEFIRYPITRWGAASLLLLFAFNVHAAAKKLKSDSENAYTAETCAAAIADAPKFTKLGFSAQTLSNVESSQSDWAQSELDPKDRLTVVVIEDDSLASKAGLKSGDILISLNDLYLSKGKTAIGRIKSEILPDLDLRMDVSILIIRDGYTMQLAIPAQNT